MSEPATPTTALVARPAARAPAIHSAPPEIRGMRRMISVLENL